MACLSIGCAFFVLRSVNHQHYPDRIQKRIQPTLSSSISIDKPKTTVIQQEIRQHRDITTYSSDIITSTSQLRNNTVILDLPEKTTRQGLIISSDGLVLIPDTWKLTDIDTTIQVITQDQKSYTGTIIPLSSTYLDLVQLDLWPKLLSQNTTFHSVLTDIHIWQAMIASQRDTVYKSPYAHITHITSTDGIRHSTQDLSKGKNMFVSSIDGTIVGMSLWDNTYDILPLTTEYIDNIIRTHSDSMQNTLWGSWSLAPETIPRQQAITSFGIPDDSIIPIDISPEISHINHDERGREVTDDINIDDIYIASWSLITHINDIPISRRSDPKRYSILFYESWHSIRILTDGQRRTIERKLLKK